VTPESKAKRDRHVARTTLVASLTVLAVAAVVWLLFRISNVLFMGFVALFVAIALEPAVHYLAKRGWRRGAATGVVFLAAFLLMVGFLVALAPLIIDQLTDLGQAVPNYVESLVDWVNQTFGVDISIDLDQVTDQADQAVGWLSGNAGGIIGGVLGVGSAIGGFFIFVTTVALFAFYMVAELPKLQKTVLQTMDEERQRRAIHIWDVAVEKMGGYIYSRLILALIGGIIAAIFLTVLKVPYALPLGIWIGVLSQFIPVIGTYLAAILPAVVALSSGGWSTTLWVVLFFIGYQQVENLLISPRITKRTMSIHPAISIAAIIIGGSLLGPIGIILALPVTGIIQALISESTKRHEVVVEMSSEGGDDDDPDADDD
jgi:predicted PurR-regulated permease PerM